MKLKDIRKLLRKEYVFAPARRDLNAKFCALCDIQVMHSEWPCVIVGLEPRRFIHEEPCFEIIMERDGHVPCASCGNPVHQGEETTYGPYVMHPDCKSSFTKPRTDFYNT